MKTNSRVSSVDAVPETGRVHDGQHAADVTLFDLLGVHLDGDGLFRELVDLGDLAGGMVLGGEQGVHQGRLAES